MKIELDIPYAKSNVKNRHCHQLLALVLDAHFNSARNQNNISSTYFINTLLTTDNMASAIASSVLTIGKYHAPITQARNVFTTWSHKDIADAIQRKEKVPGFGNAFYKDDIDPAWFPVREYLRTFIPELYSHLETLTYVVNTERQKNSNKKINPIFPNPAMYSAIVTELFGWEEGSELSFFVLARLPAWVSLAFESKGLNGDSK